MFIHQSLALRVSCMAVAVTAAKNCVPWEASTIPVNYPEKGYQTLCLDPDERAESDMKLASPFPDGVKIVYAFQNFTAEEILDMATDETINGSPENLQNAALWFEYSKTNWKKSNEAITVFDVDFVQGLNGTSQGGNGGCDGILGKKCADAYVNAVQERLWKSARPKGRKPTSRPNLYTALSFMNLDGPKFGDLPCPSALADATFTDEKIIALETASKDKESFILPSGNESWAYWTYQHSNTVKEELVKTAFGVLVHYPYVEELDALIPDKVPEEKWFTQDDFNVQLVCIKNEKSAKISQNGGEDSSDSNKQDISGGDNDNATIGSIRVSFVSLFLGLIVAGVIPIII